ncbi:MAG: hypothetical protein LUD84_09670 [Clostridiales bacterium]|nr:hypothetical protein [Clostridiales bacterium]
MIPYLLRTVAIGDRLRLTPYALDKKDNGNEHCQPPHALTGLVIYIHTQRRFATVHLPLEGYDSTGHRVDKGFNECWPIMPDERRLAHKEPNLDPETGRPAGSRGKSGLSIRGRLQSRDWSSMTSDQIAAVLGTDTHTVTTAIYALGKRGIDIPYKRRGAGPKKAAAGSTSSDSGKAK